MNKRALAVIALCLSFAWVPNVSADSRPEWLSGNSKRFPSEFYLTGLGQSSSLVQANDAARAELGKTIRVSIKSDLASRQSVTAQKSGGKSSEQISSETMQRISSSSRVDLQGVDIAENWMDPHTKEHFSLAVLDRKKGEIGLQQEMGILEKDISALLGSSEQGDDVLARIGFMMQAREKLDRHIELNQYLRVVSMTNKGREAPISGADYGRELTALQNSIAISVVGEGEYKADLEEQARGGLAKAGFKTDAGAGAMELKVAVKLEKPMKKEPWFWVRGSLTVSLIDKASGKQRGVHGWDLKSSATDSALAAQRAVTKAKEMLHNELGGVILGFADTKP